VPKKFKITASAGKMLTVFWNSEGVVLTDSQTQGATVNSECYIETLFFLKLNPPPPLKGTETDDVLLE